MRALLVSAVYLLVSWTLAEGGNITVPTGQFRTVELRAGTDATVWARENGLPAFERIPGFGGGDILRFDMEEGVWRARRQALCTDPDVAACSTDLCQSYFTGHAPATTIENGSAASSQTRGNAGLAIESGFVRTPDRFTGLAMDAGGRPVAGAQTVLVRRAPDIAVLVEQIEATRSENAADDDEYPARITPDDPGRDRASADRRPGARRCDAESRGDNMIAAVTGTSGGFSLEAPPDYDRGCWEVLTASACEMRRQPVSDQLPEFEPRKVLALVSLRGDQQATTLMASAQAIAAATGLRLLEATALTSIGKGLVRLQIDDPSLDELAALQLLRLDPRVEQSQYEQRFRVAQATDTPALVPGPESAPIDSGPNDPFAHLNYGALATGTGRLHPRLSGEGVTVAVIDTGIDSSHPEFVGRIVEQIDTSGFGLSADRHGTAVAGIIAAARDNAIGAYGVAPAARLLAIKACEPEYDGGLSARCWTSTLAKALDAVLQREASVINLSLGGPNDALLEELINKALDDGRLLLGAAGNGGPDARPVFPASHPGVLAVTAIDARDQLYGSATRGSFVDIAAPGVEIVVPVPGETYPGSLSGTSMATAYASGAAALLIEAAGDEPSVRMRAALEETAVDLGEPARDAQFGRGRLDACAAVRQLLPDAALCPEPPALPADDDGTQDFADLADRSLLDTEGGP